MLMVFFCYPRISPAPTAVEYALLGVAAEPEMGIGVTLQVILITTVPERTTAIKIPLIKEKLAEERLVLIPRFEQQLYDGMGNFTLFFAAELNGETFLKKFQFGPRQVPTVERLKDEWRLFLMQLNRLWAQVREVRRTTDGRGPVEEMAPEEDRPSTHGSVCSDEGSIKNVTVTIVCPDGTAVESDVVTCTCTGGYWDCPDITYGGGPSGC